MRPSVLPFGEGEIVHYFILFTSAGILSLADILEACTDKTTALNVLPVAMLIQVGTF